MVPVVGIAIAAIPAHALVLIFGSVAALAVAFLVALPLVVLLSRTGRFTLAWIILSAGCAATLPFLLITAWQGRQGYSSAVSVDGNFLVLGGQITTAGWLASLTTLAVVWVLGALGGAVFWLIAVGRKK